jgi:hypothetical protein
MNGGELAKWLGAEPFTTAQSHWILIVVFVSIATGYLLAHAIHAWRSPPWA